MANLVSDGKLCIEREVETVYGDDKEEILTQSDLIKRYNIRETCKWITDNKFARVCLQFPDELIHVSAQIYQEIKKLVDVDLYILGDTSYASCCVDSVAAMHVQGDGVVHYGHTCFSKTNIPVFTVLSKRKLEMGPIMDMLKNTINSDEDVKLCLFYDADYEHLKDVLASVWYQQYQSSYVAYFQLEDKPNKVNNRVLKTATSSEVLPDVLKDCICVYLGSRKQTMFNYTISIEASQWYSLDPSTQTIEPIDQTMWFKRRRFLVEKCKDANIVGILICKLAGDETKAIITRMQNLCKMHGKKSYIVSVGKPNVPKLANFPEIDIYVMISCPENELTSLRDFYRPIVYPYELEVALNCNRNPYFTTMVTDYNLILPEGSHFIDIAEVDDGADVSLITGKIRIAGLKESNNGSCKELAEKEEWALENIGKNLQDRSWKGLEQKLGETEIKIAEEGRKGIPLQYSNEPE